MGAAIAAHARAPVIAQSHIQATHSLQPEGSSYHHIHKQRMQHMPCTLHVLPLRMYALVDCLQVTHFTGLRDVTSVKLLDLDRLGFNCQVVRKGQSFKARLPFITPAEDRKGIKEAIVAMTQAARQAPTGVAV